MYVGVCGCVWVCECVWVWVCVGGCAEITNRSSHPQKIISIGRMFVWVYLVQMVVVLMEVVRKPTDSAQERN